VQIKSVFSRESNGDKKYVQDLVWEDRKDIIKLYLEGARFYTCGSAMKLAGSLKTCFIKIIAEYKQYDETKAAEILEKISVSRYSVDVFA
jgi:cytochrome P450/NADPH-cytochrome P450 reductase